MQWQCGRYQGGTSIVMNAIDSSEPISEFNQSETKQ